MRNEKHIIYITSKISPYPNTNSFQKAKFLSENYQVHLIMKYKYSETTWMLEYFNSVSIWKSNKRKCPFILWGIVRALKLVRIIGDRLSAVYSNWHLGSMIIGYLLKKITRCKWILDLWDNPVKQWEYFKEEKSCRVETVRDAILSFISHKFLSLIIDETDYIITIFPEVVHQSLKVPYDKIYGHPNGIDLKYIKNISSHIQYSINKFKNNFLLFYVGPIQALHLKYLPEIIKALSKYKKPVKIALAGPIKDHTWIRKNIPKKLGAVSVEILGSLPNIEIIKWIAQADICLCPYPAKGDNIFGYPIKVYEYMALGKPVVAFELPNLKKIFQHHRKNGILVPQGDVKSYVSEIQRLLENPIERELIGKNASFVVKEYTWQNILSELKLFLDRIL